MNEIFSTNIPTVFAATDSSALPEKVDGIPGVVVFERLDDKVVYLVGTAHVSSESVDDVKRTIELVRPDAVGVELCAARHRALLAERDGAEGGLSPRELFKKRGVWLGLFYLSLLGLYRWLGYRFKVTPGAEMVEAIDGADRIDARLVLVDRDYDVTLERLWKSLSVIGKIRFGLKMAWESIFGGTLSPKTLDEVKDPAKIKEVVAEFERSFPTVKRTLLDERDQHMAREVLAAPGRSMVVVVGAAHVDGVRRFLRQ